MQSPADIAAPSPFTEPLSALAHAKRLGIPEGSNLRVWEPATTRPSLLFLMVVAIVSLVLDVATKAWAKANFEVRSGGHIEEIFGTGTAPGLHVNFNVVDNTGGAWGLFSGTSEMVRRPFFLIVSVAAIAFILTLYRRLLPKQRALKWGLPLVLGGALGNVYDRVRWGQVVDFFEFFFVNDSGQHHWPTFNVADVAICVGVGLMAIDMITSRKRSVVVFSPPVPPCQSGETAASFLGLPTMPPLVGKKRTVARPAATVEVAAPPVEALVTEAPADPALPNETAPSPDAAEPSAVSPERSEASAMAAAEGEVRPSRDETSPK